MVIGTVAGAFGNWVSVYTIGDEEEIVTAVPVTLICVTRRSRPVRGLAF